MVLCALPTDPSFVFVMSDEEWSQAYDEAGQLYYFNTVTGETSWQLPQSTQADQSEEGRFLLNKYYE